MNAVITLRTDKKNSQGFMPVMLLLSEGKTTSKISLGFTVKKEDWNPEQQLVKPSHNEYRKYNEILKEVKERMNATWKKYHSTVSMFDKYDAMQVWKDFYNIEPKQATVKLQMKYMRDESFQMKTTPKSNIKIPYDKTAEIERLVKNYLAGVRDEEMNQLLDKAVKNASSDAVSKFKSAYKKYCDYSQREKKEQTFSRIENNFNLVKAYAKKNGLDVCFELFTKDFGSEFKQYLLKEHKNGNTGKIGMNNNAISNVLKNVKAMLNWCVNNELSTNLAFKSWNIKKESTDLQYLTEEQLIELRNFNIPIGSSYDRSRDLWMFSAYSSLRKSDIEAWVPSNVINDVITIKSQKVGKLCQIPLNDVTRSILNKYNGDLPKQADSKVNANIKEILKLMGYDSIMVNRVEYFGTQMKVNVIPLSEAITYHSGRRSFINLMISKGVHITHLSSMTGNSVKSLEIYYKSNPIELKKSMEKIRV